MSEIFVVMILDESKKKDKRSTCGHRHVTREAALECATYFLDDHPKANAYVGTRDEAAQFVSKSR